MAIDTSFDFSSIGLGGTDTTTPKKKELGQEEFLKLMITQFKNQDPFKPMDNGEFLGQLAQFSSVAGLTELKQSFADLSASMISNQTLQASSLLGRDVLVQSDTLQLPVGGTAKGQVELSNSAQKVTVQIFDSNGAVVRKMDLGTQGAGRVDFAWDGLNDKGVAVPAGKYTIKAQAVNGKESAAAPTLFKSTVESVTLGANGSGLSLAVRGLGDVAFSNVRQIS